MATSEFEVAGTKNKSLAQREAHLNLKSIEVETNVRSHDNAKLFTGSAPTYRHSFKSALISRRPTRRVLKLGPKNGPI